MVRILVVGDEEDIQSLSKQRFPREIFNQQIDLQFAHPGEKTLDGRAETEANLFLSDIKMPSMDWLELLRQIRGQYPRRPPAFIMVTAYGDADKYRQAMTARADDFLTKPLDFNLL